MQDDGGGLIAHTKQADKTVVPVPHVVTASVFTYHHVIRPSEDRPLPFARRSLTESREQERSPGRTKVESHGLAGVSFALLHGDERVQVYTHLPGRAMVHNALAAAAAGLVYGIELDDIATALSGADIPLRLASYPGLCGSTIIDDTYNASPASMLAALDLLGEEKGRKIAVLGDMRELGAAEREGHTDVGRRAAEVADVIYAVGDLGRWIGDAAIQAGHQDVRIMMDKSGIAPVLAPSLREGDVVLVKASRALALETLVAELTDGASGDGAAK